MSIKAVDLFSGAGGGSLGLERLGIDVIAGVDIDEKATQTYDRNIDSKALNRDLTQVSMQDILDDVDSSDVDMIIGCPPCQNFSSLRDTKPWDEDESKDLLLRTYLRKIRELKPKYVIFENVRGILNTDGGVHIDKFLNEMANIGYEVEWDIVNTKNYGVPQDRERVIALGVYEYDGELNFPEPTAEEIKNVRDAIGDLPKLKAGEKSEEYSWHQATSHHEKTLEKIRKIPRDGGDRTDLPKDLWLDCHKNMDGSGAENVYSRMWWDKPAPTITTRCTNPSSGRFIHPEQNRGITVREAARIQTFPDDFEFPSTKSDATRLVGNAVPPKLIEELVSDFFQINELNELR
jgi:DNA (cytosine-5)-methyltransferase 1